jgi:serine/threonine protein kinase
MSGDHPKKIGKYEIIEPLGEGGMGVVYKARDPLIGRVVAIKTILSGGGDFSDDNLVARLTQEAKAAGRLQHPNIVTVYDFGQQDDLTFLAMEYIEGTNLARVISKGAQISLPAKVDIIIQVCHGLAYAHEVGVVHRDIKPANICLTASGMPKILDFGLARFDETRLTKTGFTSGTIAYMSPERMRGNSGPHDDIFALGAVAYEILTGHVAFPGKTYKEVVSKIMSPKYPVPPSEVANLPKGFDPIVLKALSRDLADRYKSAADMARDLEKLRNTKEFLDVVSGENLHRTVAQPLDVFSPASSGANPYSAGDIARRSSDEVDVAAMPTDQFATGGDAQDSPPTMLTEQKAFQHAPTIVTAQLPSEPPADESLDRIHFEKTEMELPAVRRDQAPPSSDRTAVSTGLRGEDQGAPPTLAATPVPPTVSTAPSERTIAGGRHPAAEPRRTSAPAPSPETPLASVAEPTELDHAPVREAAPVAVPSVVAKILAASFVPLLSALFVATFAATWAGRFLVPSSYLIVYAIAVVIWALAMRTAPRLTLDKVILIAVGLRLVCFFAAPTLTNDVHRYQWDGLVASAELSPWELAPSAEELTPLRNDAFAQLDHPDTPSSESPLTVLFALVWSWAGNSLPVWRLVLLAFDLLVVWLLWSPDAVRRSLAWAALPLVTLEGVWGGHVEPIGVALLVAALLLADRDRSIGGAALLGMSAGTSLVPAAALPALVYAVSGKTRTVVLTFLGVFLVPFLFVGFGAALLDPMTRAAAQSPTLGFAQREIALTFDNRGATTRFANIATALGERMGIDDSGEWVAAHLGAPTLATLAIGTIMLLALVLVARFSTTKETGFTNCLGVALVASFASPWSWLFIVPFALLSNRPAWLLFAICSPVLYLAGTRGGEVNWLVHGIAYALPLLLFGAMRLTWKDGRQTLFDHR